MTCTTVSNCRIPSRSFVRKPPGVPCSISGGEILLYKAGFFILSSNSLAWGMWGWEGDGWRCV